MQDDIRSVPSTPQADPPPPHVTSHGFKTPEEVAAHDDDIIDMSQEDKPDRPLMIKPKPKHKFWPPTRKQLIIGGAVIVVIIAAAIGGYSALSHHKHTLVSNIPKPKHIQKDAPKPTTVASTLTGLPVNPSANQRPITAVMIENTPYARPQSGLSQAGVVIEALTEGGISRFMALFQDQLPTSVGPVRSVRPYFLDWALGFDAPLAHDGGSPLALSEIGPLGIKDLNQMYNPGPYTRISSRPSPHNLYASLPALVSLEASKGWTSSNFTGWPRKPDQPSKDPNATNISFDLSYSTYNVNYSYDSFTNSYNRYVGGAPQIDANTNSQLSPKVVIGMVVPWSEGPLDTSGAYYSVYQTTGSGQAYVFQDGTLTLGQWNKPTPQSPLSFTTSSGQPLKLNAGQTWITAIASNQDVSYN